MNFLEKKLAETFPIFVLYKRTDKLLMNEVSGFHPLKKRVYRRECKEILDSYQHMLERHREGRLIGNKKVSVATRMRMDKLKKIAR